MNLDEADSMYQQVSKNLTCCQSMIGDCDVDIDCLRSKTTEQIQIAAFGLANALKNTYVPIIRTGKLTQLAEPFAPVIDGIVVKDDPFNLISNKQFKKNVPILYDYSHNEGDTFIMQIFGMNLTQDKVEVKILGRDQVVLVSMILTSEKKRLLCQLNSLKIFLKLDMETKQKRFFLFFHVGRIVLKITSQKSSATVKIMRTSG